MSDLPLVSVITPSYNQAKFLEQTIQSVLAQNYPNIEYLVVDGASSDDSVKIIKKYEKRINWWVSEKDNGQADAINKGFQQSKGEIIAWLNSDDMYLKDTVVKAQEALARNPQAGMVFGNVLSIDENSSVFNTMRYGNWNLNDLLCFRIIGQPGVFMRRAALEQAGWLDPSFHCLLDHHLWLRIASFRQLLYVNEFLAAARYHPAAKNVAFAKDFQQEALRILDWISSDEQFSTHYLQNRHQIHAGAYNFSARYLADGGMYQEAFQFYLKALSHHPGIPLRDFKRIIFSFFSQFVDLGFIKEKHIRDRGKRMKMKEYDDLFSFTRELLEQR